jgi:drug/metabolite transporter (DMT)-like permease
MCVLAGGLIFFKKIRHMTWVDFRLGLVIGTINFLGYYLQTDATTAGLILMLESFFASVMSVIMGYDPLTPQLVIGGVILLVANAIMEVDLRSLVVLKRKMF